MDQRLARTTRRRTDVLSHGESMEILSLRILSRAFDRAERVAFPNTTYYDHGYMGNYTYSGPAGMGMLWPCSICNEKFVNQDDTIEIASWYKINPTPPPIQSPEAVAEINQEYADMASALSGQTITTMRVLPSDHNFYSRTIANDVTKTPPKPDLAHQGLFAARRDQRVYISVEGSFSGSGHPATATLAVSLKVQTRYHTNSISRSGWNYTYGELLPEKILDEDLGLWAVPSPQIRAIFAPLYQEQGSFKGRTTSRRPKRRMAHSLPRIQFCPGPATLRRGVFVQ